MKPDHFIKQLASVIVEDTSSKGNLSEVMSELTTLAGLMNTHADLKQLLISKRIKSEIKAEIVTELFKNSFSPYTMGLIQLLLDEQLFMDLSSLMIEIEKVRMKTLNLRKVSAYFAEKISDEEMNSIKIQIAKALDMKIEFSSKVQPELIGGMKLRIDNTVIDGSLAHQLDNIRHLLKKTL
ncbi:MAG: ATP synthase F1 subunit delta [Candidatus Marinimicrobia bacterium]|nr:ATP synthase F1 subunit delta [Candidatus Neomarinimicrobiota bacterium]